MLRELHHRGECSVSYKLALLRSTRGIINISFIMCVMVLRLYFIVISNLARHGHALQQGHNITLLPCTLLFKSKVCLQ